MTAPVQPLMCCGRCGGLELRRTWRSDGTLYSGRRIPGQLCAGCGAWWPIAVAS